MTKTSKFHVCPHENMSWFYIDWFCSNEISARIGPDFLQVPSDGCKPQKRSVDRVLTSLVPMALLAVQQKTTPKTYSASLFLTTSFTWMDINGCELKWCSKLRPLWRWIPSYLLTCVCFCLPADHTATNNLLGNPPPLYDLCPLPHFEKKGSSNSIIWSVVGLPCQHSGKRGVLREDGDTSLVFWDLHSASTNQHPRICLYIPLNHQCVCCWPRHGRALLCSTPVLHVGLSMAWFCPTTIFSALQIHSTVSTSWARSQKLLTSTRLWVIEPAGGLLCSVWFSLWLWLWSFSVSCSFAFALISSETNAFFWSLLMLSLAVAASCAADWINHSSVGRLRHFGPFCHSESSSSSWGVAPWVIPSARFCWPGIHHQSWILILFCSPQSC